MIRAVLLSLSLVMLSGAVFLSAPNVSAQTAEEEAVRRQNAILEARFALTKAQNIARQGDPTKALKAYSDALTAAKKVDASNLEPEMREIISGLSSVRLELAQRAAQRGDYTGATNQIAAVLTLDPVNPTAISLKRSYEKAIADQKGRLPSPETLAKVPQIVEDKAKTGTLIRDGKLLMELGKLDEAEAKLKQAAREDPDNTVAYYYLDLIKGARYNAEARKRELYSKEAIVEVETSWNPPIKRELLPVPNAMALTNLVQTGKGRQQIYQKLNEIRIPEVLFDGLPLNEVIKFLNDEVRKHDPLKRGINFIINSVVDSGGGAITVDPATGAAIPAPPAEAFDLNTVTIKINPPLQDIRLADLLDAVMKVADKPIKFSVEDYAIVFSPRRPEAQAMFLRTYKVDPNTFIQGLESVQGVAFGTLSSGGGGGGGGQGGVGGRGNQGNQGGQGNQQDNFIIPRVSTATATTGRGGQAGAQPGAPGAAGTTGAGLRAVTTRELTQQVQDQVRQFFIAVGVNLAPPANVIWNDRAGTLLVRASLQDLDLVEQAIQVLNTAPPQITIEVKFAEISQSDSKALGFDWFLGPTTIGGNLVGNAGTQGSLNGKPSSVNPFGTFPGTPQTPNVLLPGGALVPGQASTLIPRSSSDALLTGGLRNTVGSGGNSQPIPTVATLTGILTEPQFRVAIRALENRGGVDLLSAPRVTTLSGRQTQIAVVDIITVVGSVDLNQTQQNQAQNVNPGAFQNNAGVVGSTVNYNTEQLPFGPIIDVIPYVSADGYTIQMTIIPSLTEFLGYDDPGAFVPQAQSANSAQLGTPLVAQLPLPRLRARQLVTSATVWDGQTVVLGGLISENVSKIKDKVPVLGDMPLVGRFFRSESRDSLKKNLVIFVTPTIIDPAGNRVHTDADLPFARDSIPPQRVRN